MALPAGLQSLQHVLRNFGVGEFAEQLDAELGALSAFLDEVDPSAQAAKGMMRATKPKAGLCPVCSKPLRAGQ